MTSLARKRTEIETKDSRFFLDCRLSSVFQPIFSFGHRRAVGFESLVRGHCEASNRPVSPLVLFERAAQADRLPALDRQCHRLHIQNFADQAPPDRWLFLNVDAATLNEKHYLDDYIPRLMGQAGVPFERLVVELLEAPTINESTLFESVDYFRSLGALVAIDDFGTGHSNFDRIWRLVPDIVKLDRSIIFEAERQGGRNLRRMLPNLVALLHDAGSLVLIEGIETEAQAMLALDSDADFAQGFYLAKPAAGFAEQWDAQRKLGRLTDRFAPNQGAQYQRERQTLADYIKAFRGVRSKFKSTDALKASCDELLAMPGVIRCSLFNENGEPIVQYLSETCRAGPNERFRPLVDGQGGAWFRRRYFRDAINQPRRVQVSRPYLSSTEGGMCVMIAVSNAVRPRRVFCCKIAWED